MKRTLTVVLLFVFAVPGYSQKPKHFDDIPSEGQGGKTYALPNPDIFGNVSSQRYNLIQNISGIFSSGPTRSNAYNAPPLQVNTTADTNNGACTALGIGNGCTLREAMSIANGTAGADTITFAPALTSAGPATITLLAALPRIGRDLTISGPGATNLTISGNNAVRVFWISNGTSSGPTVSISNLTIANGRVNHGTRPNGSGAPSTTTLAR